MWVKPKTVITLTGKLWHIVTLTLLLEEGSVTDTFYAITRYNKLTSWSPSCQDPRLKPYYFRRETLRLNSTAYTKY